MRSTPAANISLKELVEFLARALVDKPDEVQVTEIAGRPWSWSSRSRATISAR